MAIQNAKLYEQGLADLEKNAVNSYIRDFQVTEIAERNRSAAERSLRVFDRQLAANAFMAGDRLTMADIVAFIAFDFARMARFAIPETTPHLLRWADAMRARPAATAGV